MRATCGSAVWRSTPLPGAGGAPLEHGAADLGGGLVALCKASQTDVYDTQQGAVVGTLGPVDAVLLAGELAVSLARGWIEVFDMRAWGWAALEKKPVFVAFCGFKRSSTLRKAHASGSFGHSSRMATSSSRIECAVTAAGVLYCVFEGNAYMMSLASVASGSSRKDLTPINGAVWSSSGTIVDLKMGHTIGITGHSNGEVAIWKAGSGEVLHVIKQAHSGCPVVLVLPLSDRFFTAAADGTLNEWTMASFELKRCWKLGCVPLKEMSVFGPFLVVSATFSIIIIDLLAPDAVPSCWMVFTEAIVSWKCEKDRQLAWIHVLTERGRVSTFRLPSVNSRSMYLPDVRLTPDYSFDAEMRAQSGLFRLTTDGIALFVFDSSGASRQFRVQRPFGLVLFMDGPECIKRVQARIRTNLVLSRLEKSSMSVDEAREMRSALREAALTEFGQVERLQALVANRSLLLSVLPNKGRALIGSCISLASLHLQLGRSLALAAESWPPANLDSYKPPYAKFVESISNFRAALYLLAECIPSLYQEQVSLKHLLLSMFEYFWNAYECMLDMCRVQGRLYDGCFVMMRIALEVEELLHEVRYNLFRSAFHCDAVVPHVENPARELRMKAECDWQNNSGFRSLICTDAVLILAGASADKKFFVSKAGSVPKKGFALVDLLLLGLTKASLDASKPGQIVLDVYSEGEDGNLGPIVASHRLTPKSASVDDWMKAFKSAQEADRVSKFGTDLKRVLFLEDTNIPVLVASIGQLIRHRGVSFSEIWLASDEVNASLTASSSGGETEELERSSSSSALVKLADKIWHGDTSFSTASTRDLLLLLHLFFRRVPGSLFPKGTAKRMYDASRDQRQLEAVVAELPSYLQLLLGYLLGVGLDLTVVSSEEPELDRNLYAHFLAHEMLGPGPDGQRFAWIASPEYQQTVLTWERLMLCYAGIWRSRIAPEKVISVKMRRPSVATRPRQNSIGMPDPATVSVPAFAQQARRSKGRSSLLSSWQEDIAAASNFAKPKAGSGVFMMDSSREPSGTGAASEVEISQISVVYENLEKSYPWHMNLTAGKILSMFLADIGRAQAVANLERACLVLIDRASGELSLPLASSDCPPSGSCLKMIYTVPSTKLRLPQHQSRMRRQSLGQGDELALLLAEEQEQVRASPESLTMATSPLSSPTQSNRGPLRLSGQRRIVGGAERREDDAPAPEERASPRKSPLSGSKSPLSGSKSSPSPDPALAGSHSSPPNASSGSSDTGPSPPPLAQFLPVAKAVPLRRRPDNAGTRQRSTTTLYKTHRRSLSDNDLRNMPMEALSLMQPVASSNKPQATEVKSGGSRAASPSGSPAFPRIQGTSSSPSSTSTDGSMPSPAAKDPTPIGTRARSTTASRLAARLDLKGIRQSTSATSLATSPQASSLSPRQKAPSSKPSPLVTPASATGATSPTGTNLNRTERAGSSANKPGIMQRLKSIRKDIVKPGGPSTSPPNSTTPAPVMWNLVKLVIVGQENVGKTHLCRQLENTKYTSNVSTDGIEISSWNAGKGKNLITFTTFDFGGQEIFYPTHQFFLTSRCAYVIVFRLDAADYMERVMYWVRTISASIPYAAAPPVILVGTHLDAQMEVLQIRQELENVARKFKLIQDIVFVSCTKGNNIGLLKSSILSVSVRRKLALEPVPKYYLDLWDAVRVASSKNPFCSFDEYRKMAESCGVPMDSAFNLVTKFLHDVGRLIYFEGPELTSNAVIMDPGWLAARMTDLISFKQNWKQGVVDRARLAIIWKQFDASLQDSILGILERFHVVFFKRPRQKLASSDQSTGELVVPSLLPETIDLGPLTAGLTPMPGLLLRRRCYTFAWIPLGFAARLISLFHSHAEFRVEHQWRNGLIFRRTKDSTARSIIVSEADYETNRFTLTVTCTVENEDEDYEATLRAHKGSLGDISESDTAAEEGEDSETTTEDATRVVAHQPKTLMHEVVSVIDGLIRDFCSHTPAELEVACSYCMRDRHSEPPGQFRFEILVQLFTNNKNCVPCATCFELLPIPLLAPDITFSFLPIVRNVIMGPLIGRGGFGSVFRGKLRNGTDVAVKELADVGNEERVAERFRQFQHEVCMMSLISHPNLVRMHGVMMQPRPRIIMEFCPLPDLSEILYGKRQDRILLSYAQKLAISFDVASALAYLHAQSSPIVHRDVRSPNVFIVSLDLTEPVVAKLGDYGLAATVVSKLTESLNTFQWLAPEVLKGAQYDESVDVYSLSMVMQELVANKMPFTEYRNFFTVFTQWTSFYCRLCGEGEVCQQQDECMSNQVEKQETGEKLIWKEQQVKDAILEGNLRPTIPNYCPAPVAQLIRSGWAREASARPTAQEVMASLADIMSEGGEDMSPEEVDQLRDRVRRGRNVLQRASMASLDRHSSSLQAMQLKNAKVVVADPLLLEKAGVFKVTCLLRCERIIFVGCGSGEVMVLTGWGGGDVASADDVAGAGPVLKATAAHAGAVTAMAFVESTTEEQLWTAGDDGTLIVLSLGKSGKRLKKRYTIKDKGGAVVTDMCTADDFVICCFETGDVVLYQPGDKEAAEVSRSSHLRVPIYACCVRETMLESLIFAGTLGIVYIFCAERRMLSPTLPRIKVLQLEQDSPLAVNALSVVENELWAASGTVLHSFTSDKFEPLRRLDLYSPIVSMLPVLFADSLLVWAGGRDKIFVVDSNNKTVVASLLMPTDANVMSLVQMSHDVVISGDSDGALYMWQFCS